MKINPKRVYSPEQEEKRKSEIPTLRDLPCVIRNGRSATIDFQEEDGIAFERNEKPIPASIDYLFIKHRRYKGLDKAKPSEYPDILDVETEQELVKSEAVKEPEAKPEAKPEEDIEARRQEIREHIESSPEIDFSKVPLASEEEIGLLESKHVKFYSALAKIQETHVASDFKSAYDIQDRISYLLNHRTLLYKDLVNELFGYMDSVIDKLEKYYIDISEKQAKFKHHNKKISELNRYKFKTDESIKLIDEYRREAEEELQKKTEYIKGDESRA